MRSLPCVLKDERAKTPDAIGAGYQCCSVRSSVERRSEAASSCLPKGRHQSFQQFALLAELTEALSRPKFTDKIAASLLSVDRLVDFYAELAALVRPDPMPRVAP